MILTRVEQHLIKSTHRDFNKLKSELHKCKNLYNYVLYLYRNAFTQKFNNIEDYKDIVKENRFLNKFDVIQKLNKLNQIDYRSILKTQAAQQIISIIDTNFKSWFKSLKAYNKDKSKFKRKPKMPKYLDKKSCFILVLPNQACKILNNR